jgi:ribosome recycling factor
MKDKLLVYWQSNGSRFRGYRSIDQHHHNLIEHILFQVKPVKKVLILFPDNPEEKSSSKFTYEKNIDAVEFMESSFSKLHTLTEDIAAILGIQPKAHSVEVNMSQLGELAPPRERTLSLMVEKKVRRQSDKNVTLEITGLKMNQLEDMRLSFQQLKLSEEKIKELNRRLQPSAEQNKEDGQ